MKMPTLAGAVVVVLAANAAVLLHVARNRAGEPLTTVELMERELSLEPDLDQNAGVLLRVNWENTAGWATYGPDSGLWFNREKLGELGFDVHVAPDAPEAEAFYRGVPSIPAWAALQQQEIAGSSKGLIAIDVARDPAVLRRRHQGARKVMIAGCIVRLSRDYSWDPVTHQSGDPRLRGIIIQLLNPQIWVPLPYSRILEPLKTEPSRRRPAAAPPRYTVTVAWGTRHEPWVVGCRLLQTSASEK